MSRDRHPCPKVGCPHNLPFDKFACQDHWFAVPSDLRARISRTWRSGDLLAYLEAREDAVTFLNGEPS
jgi:hypothetical protein